MWLHLANPEYHLALHLTNQPSSLTNAMWLYVMRDKVYIVMVGAHSKQGQPWNGDESCRWKTEFPSLLKKQLIFFQNLKIHTLYN